MGCHRLLVSIGACFWLASCWHTHIGVGLQYTSCKLLCSILCWRMASFLLAHTHAYIYIYMYVCIHTYMYIYIYSAAIRFCIACVLAEWVLTNMFRWVLLRPSNGPYTCSMASHAASANACMVASCQVSVRTPSSFMRHPWLGSSGRLAA